MLPFRSLSSEWNEILTTFFCFMSLFLNQINVRLNCLRTTRQMAADHRLRTADLGLAMPTSTCECFHVTGDCIAESNEVPSSEDFLRSLFETFGENDTCGISHEGKTLVRHFSWRWNSRAAFLMKVKLSCGISYEGKTLVRHSSLR